MTVTWNTTVHHNLKSQTSYFANNIIPHWSKYLTYAQCSQCDIRWWL